ncbi:MAG: class I SAM-dependent methyltransferase family protein [Patescibacteria group bacterium]
MIEHTVISDTDPAVGHEYHSEKRKAANVILVPFLNSIPAWLRWPIQKTHRAAHIFIKDAMTYRALEVAYTHGEKYPSRNAFERFFYSIWFETANVLAVRNRLRLVKRELRKSLTDALKRNKNARLLSIAAGSSRAVIEAVVETGNAKNKNLSLVFLDKDRTALEYSKILVKEFEIECPVEWTDATLGTYLTNSKGTNMFDIVEMVGLLDYFNDDRAVEIFNKIYDVLNAGGVYITGNIIAHAEKPLLSRFAGWKVIYREPETFLSLLTKSNFGKHTILVYVEPHRIHAIGVAERGNA